jgi:hypothetical protein
MRLGILIILAVLLVPIAAADVPKTFTYQGVLMDDHGDPLPDREYLVQFRLFDRATLGNELWHEDQTIFTYEGLFSTTLGEVQTLDLPFDRTYWLEMELSGEHPMEPRVQLTAVPYAIHALDAGGGGGDDDWDFSGSDIYRETGQVAIGTTPSTTGARLHVEDSTIGLYAEVTEPDAAADNRSAIYALRLQTVPNPGIGFGVSQTNNAVTAVNNHGDSYTFGLAGYTKHENPHTAGVLGSSHFPAGTEWGALSYRDSGAQVWGLYTPGAARVGETLSIDAFHMAPGAAEGYVLTSSSAGFGTWQAPPEEFSLPFAQELSYVGDALHVTNTNGSTGISAIRGDSEGQYGGIFTADRHSSSTVALKGEATPSGSFNATGIHGKAVCAEHYGIGGRFEGGYKGVQAEVTSTVNTTDHYYGVESTVNGVYGYCYGVRGRVATGDGVNYGVLGSAIGLGNNYGIYGSASNGVDDHAGYFSGNVHVNGTLSKSGGSFKIDHPLDPANKYLSHSFVESPDMMNVYNGNVILDGAGEAWVTMPDWFEALNRDFRYQLTAIGGPGPNLFVAEKVMNSQFKIAGGTPGLEVSWQVTGIRQDPYAEAHRIPVEEDKKSHERGKYLNPGLHGQPEDLGLHRLTADPRAGQE